MGGWGGLGGRIYLVVAGLLYELVGGLSDLIEPERPFASLVGGGCLGGALATRLGAGRNLIIIETEQVTCFCFGWVGG